MDDVQKMAIIDALSKPGEDYKYYVYALCEKRGDVLIPFYIGKGQSDRVWQHEIAASNKKKQREEIRELAKEAGGTAAKENARKEISAKYEKINSLGSENIEKIIIKWGLTSEEAFMAESALINLLNMANCAYPQEVTLTNIVNGHASKGEKESISAVDTMARNIDQFYKDCAQELLSYEDDFCKKGIKAIFISVNDTYPQCLNLSQERKAEAVRNSARGFWRVRSTNLPEYLIALYQQRIVGIYSIVDIKNILDMTDFPDSGLHERNVEKELIIAINADLKKISTEKPMSIDMLSQNTKNDLASFFEEKLRKGNSLPKLFSEWIKRKYYVCNPIGKEHPFYGYISRLVICDDKTSVIRPRTEKRYSF